MEKNTLWHFVWGRIFFLFEKFTMNNWSSNRHSFSCFWNPVGFFTVPIRCVRKIFSNKSSKSNLLNCYQLSIKTTYPLEICKFQWWNGFSLHCCCCRRHTYLHPNVCVEHLIIIRREKQIRMKGFQKKILIHQFIQSERIAHQSSSHGWRSAAGEILRGQQFIFYNQYMY